MTKIVAVVLLLSVFSLGCGETVHGVGKDSKRMGRGIKTFFFRNQ
ncbi:MAG: hypothetical protein ABIJ27_03570 [Candidatus Omnitrophota bacterium]